MLKTEKERSQSLQENGINIQNTNGKLDVKRDV